MTAELSTIENLPGEHLIKKGLSDLSNGLHTIETCLIRIASPRLIRASILAPENISPENAELDLYALLEPHGNNAHNHYNSLIRQLISFEQALDHLLPKR